MDNLLLEYRNIENEFEKLRILQDESLQKYNKMSNDIVEIINEYNKLIEKKDNYKKNNKEILTDTEYNEFYNAILDIVNSYNKLIYDYNNDLTIQLKITTDKKNEILSLINNLDTKIIKSKNVYNIQLFLIKLNDFFGDFEVLTLEEKKIELEGIQNEYTNILNELNNTKILSFYNPLYLTPIRLDLNDEKEINLFESNIIIDLSKYYGSISKTQIKYKIINMEDIRESIKIIEEKDELDNINRKANYIYGEKLILKSDYRGINYKITIEATSTFTSKLHYNFNINEIDFPNILTKYNNDIKRLGKLNNNKININIKDYYDNENENILFAYSNLNKNSFYADLNYNEVISFSGDYLNNCNIPIITDHIIIYPYLRNYPVLNNEYNNENANIYIYSSPKKTLDYFQLNLNSNIEVYYDLSEINEWYINVRNDSTINYSVLDDDIRSNLKDVNKELISKIDDSTLIIINPDYRGKKYNVLINIESKNDYALSNEINLEITESHPPKPIKVKELLTDHILFVNNISYDLNKYFNCLTTGSLDFVIEIISIYDVHRNKLIENKYNLFEQLNNIISIKPDYRDIIYKLKINAKDNLYNVLSDDELIITIEEPKILTLRNNILEKTELTDESYIENLLDYLNFKKENILDYLSFKTDNKDLIFKVEIDKELENSRITNKEAILISESGILELNADYRDTDYNIVISVEYWLNNEYITNVILEFYVSERSAPAPYKIDDNIIINNLNIIEYKLNLDNYFISENTNIKKPYKYRLIDSNGNYILNNNFLEIKPNVRNEEKSIKIQVIDPIYNVSGDILNVIYSELPPILIEIKNNLIKLESNNIYNINKDLGDENLIIDLNDIFKSTISDYNLIYTVITNDNVILRRGMKDNSVGYNQVENNYLHINSDYRGLSYKLDIVAVNYNYLEQSEKIILKINELERKEIKPNILNLNIDLINESNIDLINLYENSIYYPEYIYNLINKNNELFNDNKFINIINDNILNIKTNINDDFINNYNNILEFKIILYDNNNKYFLNDKTIDVLVTTRTYE